MDLQKFKDFIEKQNWTFAKTYAQTAPHEYIIHGETKGDNTEYEQAVDFIKKNGFLGYWWKRPRIYFALEGRFYWVLGTQEDPIKVMNRCDWKDYVVSMRTKPK